MLKYYWSSRECAQFLGSNLALVNLRNLFSRIVSWLPKVHRSFTRILLPNDHTWLQKHSLITARAIVRHWNFNVLYFVVNGNETFKKGFTEYLSSKLENK